MGAIGEFSLNEIRSIQGFQSSNKFKVAFQREILANNIDEILPGGVPTQRLLTTDQLGPENTLITPFEGNTLVTWHEFDICPETRGKTVENTDKHICGSSIRVDAIVVVSPVNHAQ